MASVLQFPHTQRPESLPLGYQQIPMSLHEKLIVTSLGVTVTGWVCGCAWAVIHILQWAVNHG